MRHGGAGGSTSDQRDGAELEPGAGEHDVGPTARTPPANRSQAIQPAIGRSVAGRSASRDGGASGAEADGSLLGGPIGPGEDVAGHAQGRR